MSTPQSVPAAILGGEPPVFGRDDLGGGGGGVCVCVCVCVCV